jgi:hypothetical protein
MSETPSMVLKKQNMTRDTCSFHVKHYGYSRLDYISNSTSEFVNQIFKPENASNLHATSLAAYDPKLLLDIARSFEPRIVGEEFLHMGTGKYHCYKIKLLGNKLAAHLPIKIVWFGGSNTNGRSPHPFVTQITTMINDRYSLTSNTTQHTFLNRGEGGATSCRFARGFKSEFFKVDLKDADLVFLEFAVNDGVLSTDEIKSCYESLILRISRVSPIATIVALQLHL